MAIRKLTVARAWRTHMAQAPTESKDVVPAGYEAHTTIGRYVISPVYVDDDGDHKPQGFIVFYVRADDAILVPRWDRLRQAGACPEGGVVVDDGTAPTN